MLNAGSHCKQFSGFRWKIKPLALRVCVSDLFTIHLRTAEAVMDFFASVQQIKFIVHVSRKKNFAHLQKNIKLNYTFNA
jgi:hypothetical protein